MERRAGLEKSRFIIEYCDSLASDGGERVSGHESSSPLQEEPVSLREKAELSFSVKSMSEGEFNPDVRV